MSPKLYRTALIVTVALTGLSGCATVGDLDKEAAKITYETTKTPAQLEECVSIALSSAGTPNVIRGDGRRILDFNSDGITMWTITIYETEPTRAEMRWRGSILSGKWRNRFRDCA